jgi:hypothetical protein
MFIAVTGFFPFYIFFLYPIPQLYKKFKREELKNLKGSFAHTERERGERELKGKVAGHIYRHSGSYLCNSLLYCFWEYFEREALLFSLVLI